MASGGSSIATPILWSRSGSPDEGAVLFKQGDLDGIASGEIRFAFRRWKSPRVKEGTKLRTGIGLVRVESVEEVDLKRLTERDARSAGYASRAAMLGALDAAGALGSEEGTAVYRIGLSFAGADPRVALRDSADLSPDEHAEIARRLDRLDRASRHGAWTRETLALIREEPSVRAADLAARLGRETLPFKVDVRKLKELGLVESLEVGYRISPRGRAALRSLGRAVVRS
jgi:hypothetical protein